MADTTLSFNVLARDNATRTITKVGDSFGKLHLSVGKVTKGVLAVGPALAGLAIGAGIKDFVNEARESRKVGAITAQVIKSTGGAARITADQVGNLATAISNKTGADDEAIQSGSNLLLTFTNIRNGVGKGNAIFDQATQAVTDMTAALNDGQVTTEGVKASSIQLGKALNDPIKGVTALQKVGVSFTADQKKQIKTLVDSGKTMDAQKIILKELGKEFGGAASAASDPMQKLGVIVGNVKESIGTALLPIVDKAASWIGRNLPTALDVAGRFFREKLLPPIRQVGAWVSENLVPALQRLGDFVQSVLVPYLTKLGKGALEGIRSAFHSVSAAIERNRPQLEKLVGAIGTVVKWLYDKLGPVLAWIVKTGFKVLGVAIGVVIDAIGWLVKNIPPFVKKVAEIGKAIGSAVASVFAFFKNLPGNIVRALGDTGRSLVQAGKNLIAGLLNGVVAYIKLVRGVGKWMYDNVIVPAVSPFAKAGEWLHQAGKNVLAGFLGGLKEIWAKVTEWVGGIATWIKDHKGPVSLDGRLLIPAGRAIMNGFLKGLKSGAGPAWDFVKGVGGKSREALESAYAFTSGAVPAGRAGNVALGQRMAASLYGWTGAQWDTLRELWTAESGWNNLAKNPTSSAFGIPQFLSGTARQYGVLGVTDPAQQIGAGLRYISDRYGSPIQAWGKWMGRSPHWYKQGTPWVPNDQLAYLHKGEAVIPAGVNRQRIQSSSAATQRIVLEIKSGGSQMDDLLVQMLRRYIRINGGSVEGVLGSR